MTLPDELDDTGVMLLRAAVVQQACKDYVEILIRGHLSAVGDCLVNRKFLEWFFQSKWFTLWSDSDGTYLLKKLRRMCDVQG